MNLICNGLFLREVNEPNKMVIHPHEQVMILIENRVPEFRQNTPKFKLKVLNLEAPQGANLLLTCLV